MSEPLPNLELILELIRKRDAAQAQAALAALPHVRTAQGYAKQIEELAKPHVTVKDEGSVSLDVLGAATVTFSRDATRKANTAAIHGDWEKLPVDVQNIFRFKAEIDTKAMRALGPEHAAVAAQYYSTSIGELKCTIKMKGDK